MRANVGHADRATRMTLGIMMMALGLSATVRGVAGITLVVVGALLLSTGTVGRCLFYRAFGWNTVRDEAPIPSH